jgi:hypothetical protein
MKKGYTKSRIHDYGDLSSAIRYLHGYWRDAAGWHLRGDEP